MTSRTLPDPRYGPPWLSHVVIRSARVPETADFYRRILNARVVFENPVSVVLTPDSEHHRIVVMAAPRKTDLDPAGPGVEHIAFKMPGLGELLAQYRSLKDQGIEPAVTMNHIATASFYYRDPDGMNVELFVDVLTPDQSTDAMHSEAFQRNPIGVPFDPEALMAGYLSGEPIADLLRQPELDAAGVAALMATSSGVAEMTKSLGLGEDR